MAIGEGCFKAHRGELGPKLGAGLASGPTGLQRRIELARARERAARRLRVGEAADITPAVVSLELPGGHVAESALVECGLPEQSGAERGTEGEGAGVKADLAVSTGKRAAHRPREIEGEPWVALGISRRTWERRRKKEAGG